MTKLFVKDLKKNIELQGEPFALLDFKKNTAKNGSEYYRIELGDKTGSVFGNVWNDNIQNIDFDVFEVGKIISIYGRCEEYKGSIQVNILSIGVKETYDIADFLKISDKDPEKMWSELQEHIKNIEDPDIHELLSLLFQDLDISNKFKTHPAAKSIHHAFRHGLLEHVLEMLTCCDALLSFYPEANKSLVKIGIIFHDIGKLFEMETNGISTEKTREGKLLGHVVQGYNFFNKIVKDTFPMLKKLKIEHIILSHHGILEFGSPVVPMTLEAKIVNQLDEMSSKIRQYQRILSENKDIEAEFSPRDFILGTEIYLK